MMLGGFAQTTPATEGGCRRQNSGGIILENELKKSDPFRWRRMRCGRPNLLPSEEGYPTTTTPPAASDEDHAPSRPLKKMKSADGTEAHRQEAGDDATCAAHGSISVIGRRREMEDYIAVKKDFLNSNSEKYDFFGVYDGHGGWRVAGACSERLHELVAEQHGMDWEKVMVEAFRKMDDEVNKVGGKTVEMTGSTAVVAVVGSDEVVVANSGDSRAVMGRRGKEVLQLSDDHKPERPDELERIEESGGKVINWYGQRVEGVLAMTRSIGDQYLKPFVMTEPEVKSVRRSEEDEFLIMASDGLWDVVSNDVACNVVRACFDIAADDDDGDECGGCNGAAAALAELAMARGSRDNISIIVVDLRRRHRRT